MIAHYAEHAANERTFLAWVRTGIAIIAFGFLVEKLNVFILATEAAMPRASPVHHGVSRLMGPVGRYDGLTLIAIGIVVLIVAGLRFMRTAREIEQDRPQLRANLLPEFLLTMVIALLAAAYCIYLILP